MFRGTYATPLQSICPPKIRTANHRDPQPAIPEPGVVAGVDTMAADTMAVQAAGTMAAGTTAAGTTAAEPVVEHYPGGVRGVSSRRRQSP